MTYLYDRIFDFLSTRFEYFPSSFIQSCTTKKTEIKNIWTWSLIGKFPGHDQAMMTQTNFWTVHPYLIDIISVWLIYYRSGTWPEIMKSLISSWHSHGWVFHESGFRLKILVFQSSIPFQYSIKIKCEFHPEACKERFNCSKSILKLSWKWTEMNERPEVSDFEQLPAKRMITKTKSTSRRICISPEIMEKCKIISHIWTRVQV